MKIKGDNKNEINALSVASESELHYFELRIAINGRGIRSGIE